MPRHLLALPQLHSAAMLTGVELVLRKCCKGDLKMWPRLPRVRRGLLHSLCQRARWVAPGIDGACKRLHPHRGSKETLNGSETSCSSVCTKTKEIKIKIHKKTFLHADMKRQDGTYCRDSTYCRTVKKTSKPYLQAVGKRCHAYCRPRQREPIARKLAYQTLYTKKTSRAYLQAVDERRHVLQATPEGQLDGMNAAELRHQLQTRAPPHYKRTGIVLHLLLTQFSPCLLGAIPPSCRRIPTYIHT